MADIDSIKRGNEIKYLLEKSLKEKSAQKESGAAGKRTVIFIDADSKNKEKGADTVKYISNKECFKEDVLIATSVLDNGISIKDYELRNLIIMATTREQFIQMLGRKREKENTECLNVYILLRDKKDFERFLATSEKQVKFKTEFSERESELLEEIMKSELSYQCARKICFVRERSLSFNKLAVKQLDGLYQYYQ